MIECLLLLLLLLVLFIVHKSSYLLNLIINQVCLFYYLKNLSAIITDLNDFIDFDMILLLGFKWNYCIVMNFKDKGQIIRPHRLLFIELCFIMGAVTFAL